MKIGKLYTFNENAQAGIGWLGRLAAGIFKPGNRRNYVAGWIAVYSSQSGALHFRIWRLTLAVAGPKKWAGRRFLVWPITDAGIIRTHDDMTELSPE